MIFPSLNPDQLIFIGFFTRLLDATIMRNFAGSLCIIRLLKFNSSLWKKDLGLGKFELALVWLVLCRKFGCV